jgi:phosphate-selective porin OprO/OprP
MSVRIVLFLLITTHALAQPVPNPAVPPPSSGAPASDPTAPGSPPGALNTQPTPPPTATDVPASPESVVTAQLPPTIGPEIKREEKPPQKPLEIKPGGYLQADSRVFATDTGTHELTVRRLRFKVDGQALRHFRFQTLIDTATSRLQVLNAWIEFSPRPEIGLRFGKDKAQFGIERLQSATDLAFIERAFPTQLAPNRDIGLALRGDIHGGLVHYSAAIVNGVANNAVLEAETDSEYEYNAHLLIAPFKASSQLASYGDLAIGGAATFGRTRGTIANPGLTAIRSAGQATIFSYAGGGATDTRETTALADGYRYRLAAHAYYYGGPIGVLAEYVADHEPVLLQGTHTRLRHSAWQLAASAALTPGDRAGYKSLVPKRPFDLRAGTWGAVELAARYSELRIDDDSFTAGIARQASIRRARAGTLGANWYFNRNIKLQVNYESTQFTGGTATGNRRTEHVIATRIQVAI